MEIALIVCVGWILSVCFHEFGHALVAYMGGDYTVKDKGYLTFNILKYTDPGLTLIFPVLMLMMGGIGLPGAAVYINHRLLRSRLWESAVSAAGLVFTVIAAVIYALPFMLHIMPDSWPDDYWYALAFLIQIEAFAFILNALPFPGFDGYGIIEPWLPTSLKASVRQFGGMSMWVVFGILWTVPAANQALWDVSNSLIQLIGVSPTKAAIGYQHFHKASGWLVVALIGLAVLTNRKKTAPQAADASAQPSTAAVTHFQTAKGFLQTDNPSEALTEVEKALTIDANLAEAWQLRGVCFGLLNQPAEAIENFDRALALNPRSSDAMYNRAVALALNGRHDAALDGLEAAIKNGPASLKEHAKQDAGFRDLLSDARFKRITD